MFIPIFALLDWIHFFQCMLKADANTELIFFKTPCPTEQFFATKPATINKALKNTEIYNSHERKIIYAYLCQFGMKTIFHFINTCRSLTVFKDTFTCNAYDHNDIPITMFVDLDINPDLIEWAKNDFEFENPRMFLHYPFDTFAVITIQGVRNVVDVPRHTELEPIDPPSKCIIQ